MRCQHCSTITRVADDTFARFSAADRAALILTRRGCPHCERYLAEVAALLEQGRLAGMAIGRLALDEPGAAHFQRDNRWLIGLEAPPFTLLYRRGQAVDSFGGARGSVLLRRVAAAFTRADLPAARE